MTRNQFVSIVQHYAYAALCAILAAYGAGFTTPRDLLIAGLSGIVAPILVALDPTNTLIGLKVAPKVIQVGAEAGLDNEK